MSCCVLPTKLCCVLCFAFCVVLCVPCCVLRSVLCFAFCVVFCVMCCVLRSVLCFGCRVLCFGCHVSCFVSMLCFALMGHRTEMLILWLQCQFYSSFLSQKLYFWLVHTRSMLFIAMDVTSRATLRKMTK